MKKMMKQFLLIGALCASIGAGSLHAFKHVIHNKTNHEWSVVIGYEEDCIPAGTEHEFSSGGLGRRIGNIQSGQSVAVDSKHCRLHAINAEGYVLKPCNEQNFSEHLCMPGDKEHRYFQYNASARTDGDAEYEITGLGLGIRKIK